ncbi:hypothetical protein QE390_000021 [Siphonobacter sp. SORGH_AS 1065]|nr:hypothetical protein [Siphonobacter sp. SORGH_AS_1065]
MLRFYQPDYSYASILLSSMLGSENKALLRSMGEGHERSNKRRKAEAIAFLRPFSFYYLACTN